MKTLRLFAALLLTAALAAPAFAQTPVTNAQFSAAVERPAGWVDAPGNDRAAFNFRHEESSSQIEVIATQLLTAEVAEIFFDTFHESLRSANFAQLAQADASVGERDGLQTTYGFEHAGISLNVTIFQFVIGNTAWVVVSYAQQDLADSFRNDFESVVSSLRLTNN